MLIHLQNKLSLANVVKRCSRVILFDVGAAGYCTVCRLVLTILAIFVTHNIDMSTFGEFALKQSFSRCKYEQIFHGRVVGKVFIDLNGRRFSCS